MQRVLLPLAALACIASPLCAQTVTPPLGVGGQGMGGSAAFANPFGNQIQMGNMGYGGYGGYGGSGFVPGGQTMGGRPISMNQYMGMMFLQGLANRGGSYGPRTGVANPFVTPNYSGADNQQMSLQPPKTHSAVPRMTPEERKATVRRQAEERKAKVQAAKDAAAAKKAKAAQKNAPAKQG